MSKEGFCSVCGEKYYHPWTVTSKDGTTPGECTEKCALIAGNVPKQSWSKNALI